MYTLLSFLFLPTINSLIVVELHRQSIYQSNISCSYITNASLSTPSSLNECIRICSNDYHCQTAIYLKNERICSMFMEICQKESIKSSRNISSTVICSKKNYQILPTCSSTSVPNQETTTEQYSTTSTSDPSSYWSFDYNTNDSLSNFYGTPINSPTYQSLGIKGYGSALLFNSTLAQYVNVSTYRNLTYRSFTVELWFYSTGLSVQDNGFFGQCHSNNKGFSLHYTIRNSKVYMDFFNDDLTGSITIQTNTWYHVAFVYNYLTSTSSIYLNGILDRSKPSVGPYKGTSGSIVIGKTEQIPGISNYFDG
ncbi:hypothetical protein I4U23_004494 [Adineta vaga]|nr:hypothetical protein I4U23_004494 [Adineta vaga]